MATHKEINHDSGSPVSNHYTSAIVDPSSRAAITGSAALNGSSNGLQLTMTGGLSSVRLEEGMSALPADSLRLKIHFDPNNVTPPSGSSSLSVRIWNSSFTYRQAEIIITFNSSGDTYRVSGQIEDDSGTLNQSSEYALTNEPHCIEIAVNRATDTSSGDGSFVLYVDGVAKETVSSLDIFDNWPDIDRLDVFGSATGTKY
jgi:hypothetical protein